jgi:chromosomal replication initiator protein
MPNTAAQIWQSCLNYIQTEISRQAFKTWFDGTRALKVELDAESNMKLYVEVPSDFFREWLEENYYKLVRDAITQVTEGKGRVYYWVKSAETEKLGLPSGLNTVAPEAPVAVQPASANVAITPQVPRYIRPPQQSFNQSPQAPLANPMAIPGVRSNLPAFESNLNPVYTFDKFVVGDCNLLASNAAQAIANAPGANSFNPLLVYGGVGLGKTHLIQAIGNYAKENRKAKSVLYVTSDKFASDFVSALRENKPNDFRQFYRQIDILIVDDVQFFGGKDKTQEEFFHIYNALYQSGKQIILSSDRPPRDIEGIEDRLLSRFQSGLNADVRIPDFETRLAILQKKAFDEGIELEQDVMEFIANQITHNIRELEGGLIRVVAQATFMHREIDLMFAKDVLKDLVRNVRVSLSIPEIQKTVCAYFGISDDLVRAKTRKQEVVVARQLAMFFCKEFTNQSLKTIGLHFGGRDHSTVIHAISAVEDQVMADPKFKDVFDKVKHRIELQS